MSIKISDAFESTRADKIIAEAINIKYNSKTQHAVNSELYNSISQLSGSLQDTYNKEEINRLYEIHRVRKNLIQSGFMLIISGDLLEILESIYLIM